MSSDQHRQFDSVTRGAALISSLGTKDFKATAEGGDGEETGDSALNERDTDLLNGLLASGVFHARAKMLGLIDDDPTSPTQEQQSEPPSAKGGQTAQKAPIKRALPAIKYVRLGAEWDEETGKYKTPYYQRSLAPQADWMAHMTLRVLETNTDGIEDEAVKNYRNLIGTRYFLNGESELAKSFLESERLREEVLAATQLMESMALIEEQEDDGDSSNEAEGDEKEAADQSSHEQNPQISDIAVQIPKNKTQKEPLDDGETTDVISNQKNISKEFDVLNKESKSGDISGLEASLNAVDINDSKATEGEEESHNADAGTADSLNLTVLFGEKSVSLPFSSAAEFFWSGGPDTDCEICKQDFSDEKGPAIRTMSMVPNRIMLAALDDESLPMLAIRIHNRHLQCIKDNWVPMIPISHVWHNSVAQANITKTISKEAADDILLIPLSILQIANFHFAEILGDVEIWHDYFSIPQFQYTIQQQLLHNLPKIFSTAVITIIHLDDVSSDSIKGIFPTPNNDLVHHLASRYQCMADFCNAAWFERMWVNLEYAFTQRACVLTSDRVLLQWVGSEHTKDSFTLFIQHMIAEWREIQVQLNLQGKLDLFESWKEQLPFKIPASLSFMRQVTESTYSYGEAIQLMSPLKCREYRDRFIALCGLLRLGDYSSLLQQIPEGVVPAALWIARKCLERGDHTPLLMTPCPETRVPEARWLVGHEAMTETMCYLGSRKSPPENLKIIDPADGKIRFEMEVVGTVDEAQWIPFRDGDDIQNFDTVIETILNAIGPDARSFVSTILRIYCVPAYMMDPEVPKSIEEYESLDPTIFSAEEGLGKDLEAYSKGLVDGDDEQLVAICGRLIHRLRLDRPFRSNIGNFTRLNYAGSFSAAAFYQDSLGVVKCDTCEKSFVFRIYFYEDDLPGIVRLYRIRGLGYDGTLQNGVGLAITENRLVGRMVYGTPACECHLNEVVEVE